MKAAVQSFRFRASLSRDGISFAVALALTLLTGASLYVALAVAVFVYCLVWYVESLGKELAIIPAISLIASAQWLLGPAIYYNVEAVEHYKYFMYVDQTTYYSYVLPATLAFLFGLRVFSPYIRMERLHAFLAARGRLSINAACAVFLLGLFCGVASPFVPEALRFLMFLGSQTVFVSVIYFFVLQSRWRWVALALVFGMELANSAAEGMFHNIILWSGLTLSFIFSQIRIDFFSKFAVIVFGIILIALLQSAKEQYRLLISLDSSRAGVVTLVETMLMASPWENSSWRTSQSNLADIHARLNQGWIISAVMNYVPDFKEFENGSTIELAIRDALVPRLLVDKRIVYVSEYFREYTGVPVSVGTSFGISVLGEAWVNFGKFGIVFMFLFGAFYGVMLSVVARMARYHLSIVLWTPLLFLQTLKSETELVVVINHFIKTGCFILLLYFTLRKFVGLRV